MSGFYKPFTLTIQNIPTIVYPCVGLEKMLSRSSKNSIEDHLINLHSANEKILKVGEYHIVILWDESSDDPNAKSSDIMADVWIFDKLESWGSGPLVDVKIFRNMKHETDIGVSAGDGLVMLGCEELHRRSKKTLEEYLNGDRAQLPAELIPMKEFYENKK